MAQATGIGNFFSSAAESFNTTFATFSALKLKREKQAQKLKTDQQTLKQNEQKIFNNRWKMIFENVPKNEGAQRAATRAFFTELGGQKVADDFKDPNYAKILDSFGPELREVVQEAFDNPDAVSFFDFRNRYRAAGGKEERLQIITEDLAKFRAFRSKPRITEQTEVGGEFVEEGPPRLSEGVRAFAPQEVKLRQAELIARSGAPDDIKRQRIASLEIDAEKFMGARKTPEERLLTREERRKKLLGTVDKPLTKKERQDTATAIAREARLQTNAQFTGTFGSINMDSLGKTPEEKARKYGELVNRLKRQMAIDRGLPNLFTTKKVDKPKNPTSAALEKVRAGEITSSQQVLNYLATIGVTGDEAKAIAKAVTRESLKGR